MDAGSTDDRSGAADSGCAFWARSGSVGWVKSPSTGLALKPSLNSNSEIRSWGANHGDLETPVGVEKSGWRSLAESNRSLHRERVAS